MLIAWRQRQLGRMVAARLVLSGLLVLYHAINLIEKHRRWPDRPDLDAPLRDWHEARERFFAAVTAAEWIVVDRHFENLRRTAAMVRPGKPCTDGDLDVLADLKRDLPRVTQIVSEHATPKRQRDDLVKAVRARAEPLPERR